MIHMNGSKYFIIYLNISIIPTFPLCFRASYYVNKVERTDIITVIYYIFGLAIEKKQIRSKTCVTWFFSAGKKSHITVEDVFQNQVFRSLVYVS